MCQRKKGERRITELPLQSNSGHHPTPLFWYLGFRIGWTNFAAVAMEIKKKGGLKKKFDFFHQTS
jgi:hypothetical protein